MEGIDFKWIFHLMAFLIMGLCLVFLMIWILARMSLGEIRQEMDILRKRLRIAEKFVRLELSSSEPVVEKPDVTNEPQKGSDAEMASLTPEGERETQPVQDGDGPDDSITHEETLEDSSVVPAHQEAETSGLSQEKRRVRIKKVIGDDRKIKLQTTFLGLEENPPALGRPYRVSIGEGKVLCTSEVAQITERYVQTQNSVYELEVIAEQLDVHTAGSMEESAGNVRTQAE
jgi:hypothetical protein